MTSPTKEAVERLRLSVEFHSNNGVVNKGHYEHLAQLLASHDKLVEGLAIATATLETASNSTGYCCCGDFMSGHSIYSGHTPVDQGDYHIIGLVNDFRALLKELGQ